MPNHYWKQVHVRNCHFIQKPFGLETQTNKQYYKHIIIELCTRIIPFSSNTYGAHGMYIKKNKDYIE